MELISQGDGLRAAAQFTSLVATLALNLELLILLPVSAYGRFASRYAAVLLLVGIADQGWNVLYSSRRVGGKRVVRGKLSAAAGSWLIIGICAYLGVVWRDLSWIPALILASLSPLWSLIDAQFIRQHRLATSLAARGVLMVGLTTIPALVVIFTKSPDMALSGVALAYAAAVSVGLFLVLGDTNSYGSGADSGKGVAVAGWFLMAAGLQLPNNVVSNGFLTIAGITGAAEASAVTRLSLLVLGAVIACTPVSQLHVAALSSANANRVRKSSIGKATATVAVATVAALGLSALVIGRIHAGEYERWFPVLGATVLMAPLLVRGYLLIAAGVGSMSAARVAAASTGAALAALVTYALTLRAIGPRALPAAVFVLGIALLSLLRKSTDAQRGTNVGLIGMASLGLCIAWL